jgi:hypothetical protein
LPGLIGAMGGAAVAAEPVSAEQARIDELNAAVGRRCDSRFIRNGKAFRSAQAAGFRHLELQRIAQH